MSDQKIVASNEAQNAELRDLEPEARELTAEEAEGAQGGLIGLLMPAGQTSLLPAVQMGDGSVRNTFTGGV